MSEKENINVDLSNQDFIDYDQVEKKQNYRLAEAEGEEEIDDNFQIRTCDLSLYFDGGKEGKKKFADDLGSALQEIGFAILVGHGTSRAILDTTKEKILELFTSTTVEDRMQFTAQRDGSVNAGYFPKKETSRMHPDLVEGWVFMRRAFNITNDPTFDESKFWPLPGIEKYFREYCLAQEKLILPIMQSLLTYLGSGTHLYDKKLIGTNFGLRLNYYPPIDAEDDATGAGRILGHEDVTMFTLLPAPEVEGLQVLNRKNMKWVRLAAPRGSIVLNTGDYMQRLSNDIFPSTTHRVSKPRDKSLFNKPRVSFPLNVYLWEDEIMEVLPNTGEPKYEPVRAEDFHTRITSKYYGDKYAEDK